jgi:hypothetical protein
MSEERKPAYLDASQIVYLPLWARRCVMAILGFLAISACVAGVALLFFPEQRDKVSPILSIAQTAAGGFAVVLFVLFAEKQLSTDKLHLRTRQFLEVHMVDALGKLEIPQIRKDEMVKASVILRQNPALGSRKDIYGATYDLRLDHFQMRMWIGINVRRLSVIYFAKAASEADAARFTDIFRFTFGGAKKLGYETNFEFANIDGESVVSMWSTVSADTAILGNPSEQLFWVQDVAMMTQSVIRTALRQNIDLNTHAEPCPL